MSLRVIELSKSSASYMVTLSGQYKSLLDIIAFLNYINLSIVSKWQLSCI